MHHAVTRVLHRMGISPSDDRFPSSATAALPCTWHQSPPAPKRQQAVLMLEANTNRDLLLWGFVEHCHSKLVPGQVMSEPAVLEQSLVKGVY